MESREVASVVAATSNFEIRPRGDRWCHLSLCVLDAVFSIGARYGSTWRVARRYASHADLEPVTAPAADVAEGLHSGSEQSLQAFAEEIDKMGDGDLADLLKNRQRTSSRGGVLKAAAVQQYVSVLTAHSIDTLGDVSAVMSSSDRTRRVEAALAAVPGHGSGVRVSYLWMLAGDDRHVKADRMVMKWVNAVLGRPVDSREAAEIVVAAADSLGRTPWELDHAIWRQKSGRSATPS